MKKADLRMRKDLRKHRQPHPRTAQNDTAFVSRMDPADRDDRSAQLPFSTPHRRVRSLVQSCKLVQVEPFAYLRDVLLRVATHPHSRIAELTPKAWSQTFGRPAEQTAAPQS